MGIRCDSNLNLVVPTCRSNQMPNCNFVTLVMLVLGSTWPRMIKSWSTAFKPHQLMRLSSTLLVRQSSTSTAATKSDRTTPHLNDEEKAAAAHFPKGIKYPNFSFVLSKTHDGSNNSRARTGKIVTPHGDIPTPNFVFCATKAAMKTITPQQLREEGTQFILSNTYHLMLTPGSELVEKMGGLQKFTGWNGPMLTDSGGYQIFSMGHGSVSSEIKGKRDTAAMGWNQTLIKIDEDGATFRSYVDGTFHYLTPEKSMEIQRQLGADLIVVLDECTPFNVDKDYTSQSMLRSHRWATRCLREFQRTDTGKQALYGIVQGGVYEDLRRKSCDYVNAYPFFGIAIGGSLGADKKSMHEIVSTTRRMLRNDRPIHLLGIGGIRDIFHGVREGIDTFDCVHPTRLGRHGGALVKASHWDEEVNNEEQVTPMTIAAKRKVEERLALINAKAAAAAAKGIEFVMNEKEKLFMERVASGKHANGSSKLRKLSSQVIREHINVSKSKMRNDPRPIEKDCNCYTCKNFTRAYLHHLFKAKEMLGSTLVTIHNVHFMNVMMNEIRQGIESGTLDLVEKKVSANVTYMTV